MVIATATVGGNAMVVGSVMAAGYVKVNLMIATVAMAGESVIAVQSLRGL